MDVPIFLGQKKYKIRHETSYFLFLVTKHRLYTDTVPLIQFHESVASVGVHFSNVCLTG